MQDLSAMLVTALLKNIHDHYIAVWPDRNAARRWITEGGTC